MSELFDRDFLCVIGKGGVGKTTVSAALALAARRRGKRVLLAMCNAKERLSHLLEVQPVGPTNREVEEGLTLVNMTPARALEEYGMLVLKVRSLYKAVFENRFVAAVLRGTPGIEAWAMLGKAYYHANERRPDGKKAYDLVILDAPATGHGLDMLRVPRVIVDVAPPGLLRSEAQQALELLRNAERSQTVLVTLPEDMPTNETLELHRALTEELSMPVGALVINQVLARLFKRAEGAAIAELPDKLPADSPLRSLAQAGRERALREMLQAENIARLRAQLPDLSPLTLPLLYVPEFRRSAVESLADAFL